MKTSLKVLLAIVGIVATIAFIVFLLPRLVLWYWGNNAKVYETNTIVDYGELADWLHPSMMRQVSKKVFYEV